uniref:Glyoxal oxidase N-terminal domain-containing protein n=1 Tax=Tanacetum cinerariifolium TaxID=118510 RepID=A0A6L2J7L5_TANCI|nr:hypothetical protein [Tanacetum cinerariifolium]
MNTSVLLLHLNEKEEMREEIRSLETRSKDSLWARSIKAIHGSLFQSGFQVKKGHNSCWRNIIKEVESLSNQRIHVLNYLRIKFGDGKSSKFWCLSTSLLPQEFLYKGAQIALESCKNITIADKVRQENTYQTFRRTPRGGVEQEQFQHVDRISKSVKLNSKNDSWTWNLEKSVLLLLNHAPPSIADGGTWSLLLPNIGISAMHMQLLPNDRVVMYDRTGFGTSNISLPDGKCPPNSNDCSAHSVEYDVMSNSIRPLMVLTNLWCSSGSLMPDGTLTQTGGVEEGAFAVRTYNSCDTCDWQEIQNGLVQERWYSTNHKLPDGRQIIVGGRGKYSYEFYPKTSDTETAVDFLFLVETYDLFIENNLYPFVFLYPDGNLFIFINNRAIICDYVNNKVVKTFPVIPGGQPRNYPSTGSAVLLPMKIVQGVIAKVEVMVCGGAPRTAFPNANIGLFDRALDTCGRIIISDPDPQWVMETMPMARVMGDMLSLPNGNVLIINGASSGTAGWELGRDPVLSPLIYRSGNPIGSRFEVQTPSNIPRMYHSTALLVRDGRVLVGGNNPHDKYEFTNVLYPTSWSKNTTKH